MLRTLIVLGLVGVVARADPPAPKGPLLVEATFAGAAHRTESFAVTVAMVNPGQTAETVGIWSCSWQQQWKTDDPQIGVAGSDCDKNFPTTVSLAAHARDTRTLRAIVSYKAGLGAHDLRLGFTPTNGTTIWTGKITVTVIDVGSDLTITNKGVLTNTSATAIELGEHLQVQRLFEGAWTDLSELSASACAAPQPTCVTIAAHKTLARPWDGNVCALCNCDRNGRAQPGTYRIIAHACDGSRDYLGAEIVQPAGK
jgi:hypothetical protein